MKKIVTLLFLLCSLCLASQCLAYSLTLSPQSQTINLGQTATIDINLLLNPGEELFGFNFALSYDPAIIKFENLLFNNGLSSNYLTGFTGPSGQYPDLVTFDGALTDVPAISGNLTPLASVSFTGISAGTSLLSLTGSVLDFNGFSEIPLGATGSVSPVPEPATCMLVGLGMSGLALLRRRKH